MASIRAVKSHLSSASSDHHVLVLKQIVAKERRTMGPTELEALGVRREDPSKFYSMQEEIGRGGFATVYRAECVPQEGEDQSPALPRRRSSTLSRASSSEPTRVGFHADVSVAVKVIKNYRKGDKEKLETLWREVAVMKMVRSRSRASR